MKRLGILANIYTRMLQSICGKVETCRDTLFVWLQLHNPVSVDLCIANQKCSPKCTNPQPSGGLIHLVLVSSRHPPSILVVQAPLTVNGPYWWEWFPLVAVSGLVKRGEKGSQWLIRPRLLLKKAMLQGQGSYPGHHHPCWGTPP